MRLPGRLAATDRSMFRQLVVGLVALPLSAVPFFAYGTFTPEGRLVRDRAVVALSPPKLPKLSRSAVKKAATAVPDYSGAAVALVYHGIGSASDAEGGFVMTAKRFGEHLATLKAAGLHPVTAAEVARAVALDTPLPDKAVMISFDDGRTDAMLYADPLLRQAGMTATMFVISGAAAEPGIYYAGWNKLRSAAHSGRWDIEAHSDAEHHTQKVDGGEKLPALTSLAPGETIEQYRSRVEADLERNSAAIQAHIGRRPVAFAYPLGAYGADRTNDPRIEGVLRDVVARRFAVAFHQDDQDNMGLVAPGQDRVGLRRLSVGNWSGPDLLHQIAKAVRTTFPPSPAVAELGAAAPVSSPSVVKSITPPLPPVPFLKDLRDPAPIFERVPEPPAQPAAPVTTTTTTTDPQPTPPPSPSTTSTTRPPTTTTTTKPVGNPPSTTNSTSTTATTRPSTTTTAPCRRPNGKQCAKQQVR